MAAVCIAVLALTACNRTTWQTWQEAGVFSVEIPEGQPDKMNITVDLSDQGSLRMTQLTAIAGEISFSVAYTDVLQYSPQQMQQVAQVVLQKMQLRTEGASSEGEPQLGKPFKQWQSLLGRELEVVGVVYQKNSHIVRAVCSGPTGEELDKECQHFFDTLKVE